MTDPVEPKFWIELAGTDEKTFIDVYELLVRLHGEGGYAPLEHDEAMPYAYRIVAQGMTWLARDPAGMPIGTIGMGRFKWWFSSTSLLESAWIYVDPRWRFDEVGVELMRAARRSADESGLISFITVTNPDRREKKGQGAHFAQLAGYVPIGYKRMIAGGRDDVQEQRDDAAAGDRAEGQTAGLAEPGG